jgi:hypothetical protein
LRCQTAVPETREHSDWLPAPAAGMPAGKRDQPRALVVAERLELVETRGPPPGPAAAGILEAAEKEGPPPVPVGGLREALEEPGARMLAAAAQPGGPLALGGIPGAAEEQCALPVGEPNGRPAAVKVRGGGEAEVPVWRRAREPPFFAGPALVRTHQRLSPPSR